MFYLIPSRCKCKLDDVTLLDREIPSFIINSNGKGDDLKTKFAQLIMRDVHSFIEMIIFMDSLDRENYLFKTFSRLIGSIYKDPEYMKYYRMVVDHKDYLELSPQIKELYKSYLQKEYGGMA